MARPDRSGGNRNAPSAPMPVGGVRDDIRALNSSLLLITQKIKYIVRNEKILGRNLIVLNKKLKSLEEKVVLPANKTGSDVSSEEVNSLKKKVDLLEAQLSDLQSRMVSKEDFKELKYIIDSINPLEFATLSQVKDLINKKMK
ncbi:MAG: hypothetical protein PHX27_03915 [Candidatus ainarchaeum sp.]|nr:hypothetical protein [Candidatus ainarchaeum sp.]